MRRLKQSLRNASPRTKRNFNLAVQEIHQIKGGDSGVYYVYVKSDKNPRGRSLPTMQLVYEGSTMSLWKSVKPVETNKKINDAGNIKLEQDGQIYYAYPKQVLTEKDGDKLEDEFISEQNAIEDKITTSFEEEIRKKESKGCVLL